MKSLSTICSLVLSLILLALFSYHGALAQTDPEKTKRAESTATEVDKLLKLETRAANQEVLTRLPEARRLMQELNDHEGESVVLGMAALAQKRLGEYEKAVSLLSAALALTKDVRVQNTIYLAKGQLYVDLGQKDKAVDSLELAVRFSDSIEYKKVKIDTLRAFGEVYAAFGDIERAIQMLDQAEELLRPMAGSLRQNDLVDLHNQVGIILMNAGRLPEAFKRFAESHDLAKKLESESRRALAINNRGYARMLSKQPHEAIKDFREACEIFDKQERKDNKVLALNNLGMVLATIGERDSAQKAISEAILLSKELKNRRHEALSRNQMAVLLGSLGEHRLALEELKLVEAIRYDLGERQGEKVLFTNIGQMYAFLDDVGRAREYFDAALRSTDPAGNAATYLNIGMLHHRAKEYQKVLETTDRAIAELDRTGDRSLYPAALNNRAVAMYSLGRFDESAQLLETALYAYSARRDRHGEAMALGNLMDIWRVLGKRDLAIFYGKLSVNQYQSLRSSIRSFEGDVQQSFLGTAEGVYRILIELLIDADRIGEAEQVVRMLKDEEYFSFIGRDGNAIPGLDQRAVLTAREKEAADRIESIGARDYGSGEKDRDTIQADVKTRQRLFELPDKAASGIDDLSGGSMTAVRNWKDPGSVLVSTVVAPRSLILIVTSARSRRAVKVNVTEDDLARRIGQFRRTITERGEVGPVSQELYDLIISPIRADLKASKARTIIWSLDKFLRYLPISALRDARSGYVAEEFATVVLAQAGRHDLAVTPKGKARWRAVAAGVSKPTADLEALRHVPSELCAVVRGEAGECDGRVGAIPGIRMLNERFTLSTFTEAVPDHQVAHIATHFKFISGTKAEGLQSFLLLGNGEKLTMDKVRASTKLFDGIELLTLSACDTAYGGKTEDGREIEGFGVLAQKQGARSILATLWRADDESTRDAMADFYQHYRQAAVTKAEALRQVQLKMIGRYGPNKMQKSDTSFAHPYFWAPFILIGNWR